MSDEVNQVEPDPAGADSGDAGRRNLLLFAPAGTGLRAVAVCSVTARLPVGTTAVALPLFALADAHSAAVAGVSVGCYRLAQAAASPVWGRLADRVPLSRLFGSCGLTYGAVLCAIALWGQATAPLLVLSLLLGAAMLPHTALMRSFWRRQPDLADRLTMTNAFESFMSEGILLAGRLLVAVLFLALSPGTLLFTQAAVAVAGGVALASRRRIRREPRHGELSGARSRSINVLKQSAPVIGCFLIFSASLGAFSIGLTLRLHTHEHGNTWTALAIGAWGFGSLAGVYLLAHRVHGLFRRWFTSLGALMAVAQLIGISTTNPWITSAVALLAGLPIAAAVVCLYGLLDARRSEGHHTEQLAWATTAIFAGDAVGGAVAGAVAGHATYPALPVVCGAVFALVSCGWVGSLRATVADR